jgi:hypothetical protein
MTQDNAIAPSLALSDQDRDLFLAALDNPPAPTDAALKAAKALRKQATEREFMRNLLGHGVTLKSCLIALAEAANDIADEAVKAKQDDALTFEWMRAANAIGHFVKHNVYIIALAKSQGETT